MDEAGDGGVTTSVVRHEPSLQDSCFRLVQGQGEASVGAYFLRLELRYDFCRHSASSAQGEISVYLELVVHLHERHPLLLHAE